MLNVQGLRRNVKNVVRNYTDAQVKVREATSNDPWGPSSTLMSEIADLTYNVVAFSEIMQMIWKRLNDHGKNWRHVYKALVLLEYLIKTGSEKVAQQCKENIYAIQTLKDFQYVEENKDQGMNVREKSRQLVSLLKDDERLKSERSRALKAKERFAQASSRAGNEVTSGSSPVGKESLESSPDGLSTRENAFDTKGAVSTELENARPQTAGEEELQLQLALAMSKEEAEQEERLRRNDDLRLQMALNESQENYQQKGKPEDGDEAAADLLNLSLSNSGTPKQATDPWGVPVAEAADPWQAAGGTTTNTNDPWNSTTSPVKTGNAWVPRMSTSASVSFETLGGRSNGDLDDSDFLNKRSAMSSPDNSVHRMTPNPFDMAELRESFALNAAHNRENNQSFNSRKTPETFLGPNSNLVNLDALVSSQGSDRALFLSSQPRPQKQNEASIAPAVVSEPGSGNPFGIPPAVNNPFQAMRPPPPTINQLRAQMQIIPPIPSGVVVPPVMPTPGLSVGIPAVSAFSSNPQANNPFL